MFWHVECVQITCIQIDTFWQRNLFLAVCRCYRWYRLFYQYARGPKVSNTIEFPNNWNRIVSIWYTYTFLLCCNQQRKKPCRNKPSLWCVLHFDIDWKFIQIQFSIACCHSNHICIRYNWTFPKHTNGTHYACDYTLSIWMAGFWWIWCWYWWWR